VKLTEKIANQARKHRKIARRELRRRRRQHEAADNDASSNDHHEGLTTAAPAGTTALLNTTGNGISGADLGTLLPQLRHTAPTLLLQERRRQIGSSFAVHQEVAERVTSVQKSMERKLSIVRNINSRSSIAQQAADFADSTMGSAVAAAVAAYMHFAAIEQSTEEIKGDIKSAAQSALLAKHSDKKRSTYGTTTNKQAVPSHKSTYKPLRPLKKELESDIVKRNEAGKIDYHAAAAQVAWRNVGITPKASSDQVVRGEASSFLINASGEAEDPSTGLKSDGIAPISEQEENEREARLYAVLGEWPEYHSYFETHKYDYLTVGDSITHLSLMKILQHPLIQSRLNFDMVMLRLLQYKSTHYGIPKQHVTCTLDEVLYFLRPFITVPLTKRHATSAIENAMQAEFEKEEFRSRFVSLETLTKLRAVFQRLDPEGTGTIPITALMRTTATEAETDNDEESRAVLAVSMHNINNTPTDMHNMVDESAFKKILAGMDPQKRHKPTINFEEFVELFKNSLETDGLFF
jgi:hypothetical protein